MPRKTRKAIRAFRVRDLMITLLPGRSGSGETSIPVDDGPPLPTPITPVAATALISPKIQAFRKFATPAQPINSEFMDRFAREIGYDVLGHALCTSDMPTSPTLPPDVCLRASFSISDQLLTLVRTQCQQVLAHLDQRDETSLAEARRMSDELIPQLQEVIEHLQVNGKP